MSQQFLVATTNDVGTLTSQQRFLPFGGTRDNVTSPNAANTDYTYTGQRNLDPGMGGLMDYREAPRSVAEWAKPASCEASPLLGRFTQPDTLIPDPGNPQAWNRFSYVANRPVNYNDPTGHYACGDGYEDDCDSTNPNNLPQDEESGFTDDDIEDILAIANDGDFITYSYGNDVRVAIFALDPDNNLVLYDVTTKSIIDLNFIAEYGTGFYTYDSESGGYELNPAVDALAPNQNDLQLINTAVSLYSGEYNISIHFNYYYNFRSLQFITDASKTTILTLLTVLTITGGTELIPVAAGLFVDVGWYLLFGGELDPNNPMDVRLTPVQPLPTAPQIITDPEGYFSPFPYTPWEQ